MMQFLLMVVLQGLLLCAGFHRTVKDKISLQEAKQRSIDRDTQLFEEFVSKYNRTYKTNEYKRRFDIFRENLDEIDRRNAKYAQPVHGITKFADWTSEEFQRLQGYRRPQGRLYNTDNCTRMRDIPDVPVPDTLDYRKQNLVTTVKNQMPCGTCWAFSATGNIEGQFAKKYKNLVSFSEQQLLDCVKGVDCQSGYYPSGAEKYVKEAGGIMTEADYPYLGQQSKCQFNSQKVKAKLSGCEDWLPALMAATDETALKKLLVSRGPLAFAIDARPLADYTGGIVQGDDCDTGYICHAVLLVGYGKENNTPYWLVKNSWGANWGEDGYFRMQYGENCLGMLNSDSEFVNAVVV